jgi:hypothetical protein
MPSDTHNLQRPVSRRSQGSCIAALEKPRIFEGRLNLRWIFRGRVRGHGRPLPLFVRHRNGSSHCIAHGRDSAPFLLRLDRMPFMPAATVPDRGQLAVKHRSFLTTISVRHNPFAAIRYLT